MAFETVILLCSENYGSFSEMGASEEVLTESGLEPLLELFVSSDPSLSLLPPIQTGHISRN